MAERRGTRKKAQRAREDALRQLLQKDQPQEPMDLDPETGLPIVPPPPGWDFSGDLVGPGTEIARMFRRLEGINPEVRGRASSITLGPNTEWIKYVFGMGQPEFLGQGRRPLLPADVVGSYSPKKGSIYLDPHHKGADLFDTLAHELQHATSPTSILADDPEGPANVVGAVANMVYRESDTPPRMARRSKKSREMTLDALDELFKDEPWYRQIPSKLKP
jgi:hypothetical protein